MPNIIILTTPLTVYGACVKDGALRLAVVSDLGIWSLQFGFRLLPCRGHLTSCAQCFFLGSGAHFEVQKLIITSVLHIAITYTNEYSLGRTVV